MRKQILIVGIVYGALSVILGAFAAHGLKDLLETQQISTFETGVRYQMYHSLFLLVLSQMKGLKEKFVKFSFWCVVIGVLLFSGSIYGLATNSLSGFDFKSIAFITPIGGLFLIIGWLILLFGLTSRKD